MEEDSIGVDSSVEIGFVAESSQPVKIPWQRLRHFKTLLGEFSGEIFFVLAFIVTALIALLNFGKRSETAFTNVLLVALGTFFQFIAYSQSNKAGRADPTLVRSAVRDLYMQVLNTREVRVQTEKVLESGSNATAYEFLGKISVHLSYIEENFSRAAKNWAEFHQEASKVIEEIDQ